MTSSIFRFGFEERGEEKYADGLFTEEEKL